MKLLAPYAYPVNKNLNHMYIQFNAFIPRSIGTSLAHCQLPYTFENKEDLKYKLFMISGWWISEPFSNLIFCRTEFYHRYN